MWTKISGARERGNKRGCCMRPCRMARFCAFKKAFLFFLCLSMGSFRQKMACKKTLICSRLLQKCAKSAYAIPSLVVPPCACHRQSVDLTRRLRGVCNRCEAFWDSVLHLHHWVLEGAHVWAQDLDDSAVSVWACDSLSFRCLLLPLGSFEVIYMILSKINLSVNSLV